MNEVEMTRSPRKLMLGRETDKKTTCTVLFRNPNKSNVQLQWVGKCTEIWATAQRVGRKHF